MPLLKRREWVPNQPRLSDLQPSEEVFVVRATGEVFHEYDGYLERMQLLRSRSWSCKYTGKSNLTFEEALAEEERSLSLVAKFPAEFEPEVLRIAHHSPLPLDQLLNKVYELLKPTSAAPPAGDGGKENEPGKEKAPKHPLPKNLTRFWIIENCVQQEMENKSKVWAAKPPLARKHGLPEGWPEGMVPQRPPPPPLPANAAPAGKAVRKTGLPGTASPDDDGVPRSSSVSPGTGAHESTGEAIEGVGGGGGRGQLRAGAGGGGAAGRKSARKSAASFEDQLKSLQSGSVRFVAFHVLREAGTQGMAAPDIGRRAVGLGLWTQEDANAKTKQIHSALGLYPDMFARVRKGVYALRLMLEGADGAGAAANGSAAAAAAAAAGGAAPVARADVSGAGDGEGHSQFSPAGHKAGGAARPNGAAGVEKVAGADEEVDSLTKAEVTARKAKAALARAAEAAKKAEAAAEVARERLEAAKAASRTPQKRRDSDATASASAPSAAATGDGAEAAGTPMPSFELPPELREYSGDSGDRKALMAWKKERQQALTKIEQDKEAWQRLQRSRKDAARREAQGDVHRSYKRAVEAVEEAHRALAAAEKAALDADRSFTRERAKVEARAAKDKAREARERVREAEREERERRRQEALQAKRYPIDDGLLLAELREKAVQEGTAPPPADLPQPAQQLSAEEGERLAAATFVADFVSQFSRQLGGSAAGSTSGALTLQQLDRMLNAGLTEPPSAPGTTTTPHEDGGARDGLHGLYTLLLKFLLDEARREAGAGGSRLEKLWSDLLSEATWPEVLRRFVLRRAGRGDRQAARNRAARARGRGRGGGGAAGDEAAGGASLVPGNVSLLAGMLGMQDAGELHCDQHLCLLAWLCDEALATERLRDTLTRRMEEVEGAKRGLREGCAEDRKRLKELVEVDKEARRRAREAEAGKRDAMLQRRKELEEQAARAAAEGKEVPDVAKLLQEEAAAQRAMEGDGDSEDEAETLLRFELPPELVVYSGDEGDRKAMLQFRQRQQEERRRLEKAKQQWLAQQRQRRKERDAEKRAAAEAEKAKQKEREAAEEKLLLRQEAYEREIEKYAVRRQPVGTDRAHRRYWWGLAGNRQHLYVQDGGDGSWAAFTRTEELDALMDGCDKRGVRECILLEGLEKRYRSIADALKKAAAKRDGGGAKDVEPSPIAATTAGAKPEQQPGQGPGRVQPGRRGKPADLKMTDGRSSEAAADGAAKAKAKKHKTGSADHGKEEEGERVSRVGGFEGGALDHAAAEMGELAQEAVRAKVEPPPGCAAWKKWAQEVEAVSRGEGPGLDDLEQGSAQLSAAVRLELKSRLLALEAAVWAASKDGRAAAEGREEEPDEEEEEDGEQSQSGADEEEEEEEDDDGEDDDGMQVDGEESGSPSNKRRRKGNKATAADAAALLSPGGLLASIAEEQERGAERRRDKLRLWGSRKQRELWQADVQGAATSARLAYCSSLINEVGQDLLDALREANDGGGGGKQQGAASGKRKVQEQGGGGGGGRRKRAR